MIDTSYGIAAPGGPAGDVVHVPLRSAGPPSGDGLVLGTDGALHVVDVAGAAR